LNLSQYKKKFDEYLVTRRDEWTGNRLGEACLYALGTGGKRIRPVIVYLVADALGKQLSVNEAALSTEYFHTASLIADDLPCMDNDDMRRGAPSLHKKFDEPTALLASYALITAAFEQIYHASKNVDSQRALLALNLTATSAGFSGATGGQYLDLMTESIDSETLTDVIYKKTVTLFQVAFGLGFLFGGGDLDKFPLIKKAGYHFGMSFQIADDISDYEQDSGRLINSARFWGKEKAASILERELSLFETTLRDVGICAPAFRELQERIAYLAAGAVS
jgi:geranylgeranyl diphosphate synthase, type II